LFTRWKEARQERSLTMGRSGRRRDDDYRFDGRALRDGR
jgi:hypothetical protein